MRRPLADLHPLAAFLRVGFYFVDEGQRLTREKKKVTQAENDDHDRPALQ